MAFIKNYSRSKRYVRKYKKPYKKSYKKSSYKKTYKKPFTKKQYKKMRYMINNISQSSRNTEWKQLVHNYSISNTSTPTDYNYLYKPLNMISNTPSVLTSNMCNKASGMFSNVSDRNISDAHVQYIEGRRINIKSIYIKGLLKFKNLAGAADNIAQKAGFKIYKQRYNKFDDVQTSNTNIPTVQQQYKDLISTTTNIGVQNMYYKALQDPAYKKEFKTIMSYRRGVSKFDDSINEIVFKINKFRKFKNGLPIVYKNGLVLAETLTTQYALPKYNVLYFMPWFDYIPADGSSSTWTMDIKIYINYTDC